MRFFWIFIFIVFLISFTAIPQIMAQNTPLPEKISQEASNVDNVGESKKQEQETSWDVIVVATLICAFIFLFFEIAVIPGFGVSGIIGILLLIGGLATAFIKLTTTMAVLTTIIAIVGVVLLILWFLFIFPKTSMGSRFILQKTSAAEEGFVAVDDKSDYIGKEGITLTILRPSGIAKIEDERIDVMSNGEFVEKDVPIRVIKTRQGGIIVTPITKDSQE